MDDNYEPLGPTGGIPPAVPLSLAAFFEIPPPSSPGASFPEIPPPSSPVPSPVNVSPAVPSSPGASFPEIPPSSPSPVRGTPKPFFDPGPKPKASPANPRPPTGANGGAPKPKVKGKGKKKSNPKKRRVERTETEEEEPTVKEKKKARKPMGQKACTAISALMFMLCTVTSIVSVLGLAMNW
uniref:Lysine-rich arabinogalactan protein 19-like n=1 Tax=Steinernema glaseri TaxID=37863 RepID=A0A1I7ZRS2_9BILA